VQSIDFAYDGAPCFIDCTGIAIDTFEDRTTSGGWGTASTGLQWQGGIGGGGVSAAVSSGEGHFGGGTAGTAADVQQYIYDTRLWSMFAGDFDFLETIRFDNGPTAVSGDYLQHTIGYTDDDGMWWRLVGGSGWAKIGWWHAVVVQWGADSSQTRIGVTTDIGDQNTDDSSISWALISLSAGVDYNVRWARTGTTVHARIWDASTTEPSTWDVEDTVTADFPYPTSYLVTLFTRAGSPAVGQFFSTKLIGDGTCTGTAPSGGGGITVASEGNVCEDEVAYVDGTTYQLVNLFTAGSSTVWLNGHQLRRGTAYDYVEHPQSGTIELLDPVDPTDLIRVCYFAVGRV
jgi:hypothetical protein